MESKTHLGRRFHCVVLIHPAQGQANPILQLCKILQQKHEQQITITLVTTRFFYKNLHKLPSSFPLETISDGFDNGGIKEAENFKVYFDRFQEVGTQTLCELIEKLNTKGNHVDCIYYHLNKGMLQLPLLQDANISISGLPSLSSSDMPSYIYEYGSGDPNGPDLLNLLVADCLTNVWPKLRTIGPTLPYEFLDTLIGVEDEQNYGLAQFKSEDCTKWLDDQPKGSVVFVSFGSFASLNEEKLEELAWGLRDSDFNYLWVVREPEQAKLPKDLEKKSNKGLVVSWCHQMKVLSHEAIGCFVTHCGWNSTLEALSLGVPMIAIPQWSDQTTNAKFITDVWKVGVRATIDDKGILRRETLKNSVWEVMKSGKRKKIMDNVIKWRNVAAKAVDKGGSSHKSIEEFGNHLLHSKSEPSI